MAGDVAGDPWGVEAVGEVQRACAIGHACCAPNNVEWTWIMALLEWRARSNAANVEARVCDRARAAIPRISLVGRKSGYRMSWLARCHVA